MNPEHIRSDAVFPNGFMRTFQRLKSKEPVEVTKIHMLLSQARTGSTLICDYLTKAGDLGWCDEWLNPKLVNIVARETGHRGLQDNLQWTLGRAASPTGVVTINLQIPHVVFWKKQKISLQNIATRMAYLTRASRLEQALSLAKAEATNIYHQVTTAEKPVVEVSNLDIATALYKILSWDEVATEFIGNKECLRLTYEDVCQNLTQIDPILAFFGSSVSVNDLPKSNLQKQQTEADRQRLRRFLSDLSTKLLDN